MSKGGHHRIPSTPSTWELRTRSSWTAFASDMRACHHSCNSIHFLRQTFRALLYFAARTEAACRYGPNQTWGRVEPMPHREVMIKPLLISVVEPWMRSWTNSICLATESTQPGKMLRDVS